jgi:uncharacterized protein (UPF0548 family)
MKPLQENKQKLPWLTAALVVAGGAAYTLWHRNRLTGREFVVEIIDPKDMEQPVMPPELGEGDDTAQPIRDGSGPLFHRRYRADIFNPDMTAEQLMAYVKSHLNECTPSELAVFRKMKGDENKFEAGDEWYIHITGPWDGPVRTVSVTPTSFSFITLKGHVEAGQITFRAQPRAEMPNVLRFEIMSWSRSKDLIVNLGYDKLQSIKTAQTAIWTTFCERVAKASGGSLIDKVNILTQRTRYEGEETLQRVKLPVWHQYKDMLESLRVKKLNYDAELRENFTEVNGWRIDSYSVELPSEQPGEPEAQGSFEIAQEVIRNYEFPDPNLITGIFVPDDPLENRLMILKARFMLFTFHFGVRVSEVIDEIREDPTLGKARVWGWSYRTLEGHFEMGEITFSVWKFLQSGRVEFRINAYSKVTHIPNIFYRIGFRIFGRSLQVYFAHSAMDRMKKFVADRLAERKDGVTSEQESDKLEKVEIKSTRDEPAAQRQVEKAQQVTPETSLNAAASITEKPDTPTEAGQPQRH